MKLIERIKPEVMEVIKYKLPLFLEEWLEKEITPIELPIGLASVLYREAYDGPFDYGKYLRMFVEPVIDMTLEEAVNKGFDKRIKLNLNEDDELSIYHECGSCLVGRNLKVPKKK